MILASCSIGEAEAISGVLMAGKEKVFLNVEVDGSDFVRAYNLLSRNASVKSISVKSNYEAALIKGYEVPTGKNIFMESEYPEVVKGHSGYDTLVRLPDNFSDMRALWNLQSQNSDVSVRFIGGKLLEIPGLHIGRYDTGKEKMSSYFQGIYDCFLEVKLSDLDNLEVLKTRLGKRSLNDLDSVTSEGSVKEKKEKKPSIPKAKVSLTNLFGSEMVDF